MSGLIFVGGLTVLYAAVLWWSCRNLPAAKWQVAASMPLVRNDDGSWHGLNITYYGVLQATAMAAAGGLVVIMMGAMGVTGFNILLIMAAVFAVCLPASKWMARLVEKKPQTLTIGGASFVGILLAPWIILAARKAFGLPPGSGIDVLPVMAALTVSYAVGEGIGRLACISFGCCYGKPLEKCHPLIRRLFKKYAFVFTGPTKKVAYEGHLEGCPVMPIQAITSAVSVGSGLIGLSFFFLGRFTTAFLLAMTLTQGWRAVSETLRADYRGGGKMTTYQKMALIAIGYSIFIALFFPALTGAAPRVAAGLMSLWDPAVILFLEALWIIVLLFLGRSQVTAATIHLHVVDSKI
ncbi:MAG: prolipoprotein diacylglyceryl transferase family protein [Pseudomonadota bacterium]